MKIKYVKIKEAFNHEIHIFFFFPENKVTLGIRLTRMNNPGLGILYFGKVHTPKHTHFNTHILLCSLEYQYKCVCFYCDFPPRGKLLHTVKHLVKLLLFKFIFS